jgi:DNA-binding transcriptional LysR family regulator
LDQSTRRYPRIVFDLQVGNPGTAYRAVVERRVDLAVARIDSSVADEYTHMEVLYDAKRFVVAAGARNPWCQRHSIEPAALVSVPWSMHSRDSIFGTIIMVPFGPAVQSSQNRRHHEHCARVHAPVVSSS